MSFIDADPLIALQIHPFLFKMVEIVEWGRPRLCSMGHSSLPLSCCFVIVIFISKSHLSLSFITNLFHFYSYLLCWA